MEKAPLYICDRVTKEIKKEKIVASSSLRYLYERKGKFSQILLSFTAKLPIVSYLYGKYKSLPHTKKGIPSFVKEHGINLEDFENKEFKSFSDFFVRHLRQGARPLSEANIIVPADGRYLAFQNISKMDGVFAKGQKLSLLELIGNDKELFSKYKEGSMVIARLAPMDYHRFHFPADGVPTSPKLINGSLFSVNPIALSQNIQYLTQNKRALVTLKTEGYGDILIIAIGATNVGSIQFTYQAEMPYERGDEMGYFALGGSMMIYLFEQGCVTLSSDILEMTNKGIEMLSKMGQELAK